MKNICCRIKLVIFSILMLSCISTGTLAQHFLDKVVTVEARKKPVSDVLESIGRQGGFYFSYNTNIVKQDSLVTVYAYKKTVREVLGVLFEDRFEYKEKSSYVIIQKPEYWYVSGYVTNSFTGEKIPFASVYDKQQMISTLTDDAGYFRLKLKYTGQPSVVTVSRSWYSDTSLVISTTSEKEVTINISPKSFTLDTLVVTQHSGIEKNWWSRLFLSSRQSIQSLNIDKYFVDMPFQTSLTPGLSTHGNMNSQVINKGSLNVLGGYTAGTNGVEIGGMFNIVRKDVRYVQVAGLFNNVGGKVEGVQMAGLFNNVLDTMGGVQGAGLSNVVMGSVKGVQMAGISNYANHETEGSQMAGVINIAGANMRGVQLAGVINIVRKRMEGAQIGIINIAETLNGTQVGVINIADTSSGLSLGILSLIRKGYHKISLSANEAVNCNVELKIGTKKLYTIFLGGMNIGPEQAFTFGIGYGADIPIWRWISLSPQATCQHVYLGDWEHTNLLGRAYMNVNIRIHKRIAIYYGPTLNGFYQEQTVKNSGYKIDIPGSEYSPSVYSGEWSTWIGWNAGITFL